jgi:hypothetical protein
MNPLMMAAAERRKLGRGLSSLLGRNLIAGNSDLGYYGVFTSSEVIRGDQLASLVGVSQGASIFADAGWLGFSLDGKRLLVAKKPIRHTLSWDHLNAAGVALGKDVTIKNTTMKVRLLRGAAYSPARDNEPFAFDDDSDMTKGSEWNRTLYHVSKRIRSNGSLSTEGIATGDFAQFLEDELGISGSANWRANWTQEKLLNNSGKRIYRGNNIVSDVDGIESWQSGGLSWRPVLELIV